MTDLAVGIIGATGLVGTTLLSLFEEKNFPVGELHLAASAQSSGKDISFRGKKHRINDLATFDFSRVQLAFFCVGTELAAKYAPLAANAGCVIIDKSHFFRNDADVPLIVPEVNLHALAGYKRRNIIASPNCSTIPLAVALKPIYDAVGITRINVATYQSVSGTGKDAIQELTQQTKQYLANEPIETRVYQQQIAFNVLPHIDDFLENGYTKEEMKIVNEMRKILEDPSIAINPTAVRVPVYCGHAAAVHLETKEKLTAKQATALLAKATGVKLITGSLPYPTPLKDAAGNDLVYVGRIREDISHPKGLNFWVVSDNLRKGAALNSIQIAEHLIKNYL